MARRHFGELDVRSYPLQSAVRQFHRSFLEHVFIIHFQQLIKHHSFYSIQFCHSVENKNLL